MGGKNKSRESFIAYRSFEKQKLPDTQRLLFYDALFAYALRREVPDFKGDVTLECIWECVVPQIDANYKRFENGSKGGAPLGSRNNPNGRRGKRTNQKLTENLPNYNVNAKDNDNLVEDRQPKSHTHNDKFVKPTPDVVREYCNEGGYTSVDADRFCDYYESKGWKVGSNPMKDWKAAVRNWERNRYDKDPELLNRREGRKLSLEDLV